METNEKNQETVEGRVIRKKPLTIRRLKEQGIPPSTFIPDADTWIQLTWDLMIRLANAVIEEGEPITENDRVTTLLKIFGAGMKKGFL